MPAEPMGATKIFQLHCGTNILHSVSAMKSRIQVYKRDQQNSKYIVFFGILIFSVIVKLSFVNINYSQSRRAGFINIIVLTGIVDNHDNTSSLERLETERISGC